MINICLLSLMLYIKILSILAEGHIFFLQHGTDLDSWVQRYELFFCINHSDLQLVFLYERNVFVWTIKQQSAFDNFRTFFFIIGEKTVYQKEKSSNFRKNQLYTEVWGALFLREFKNAIDLRSPFDKWLKWQTVCIATGSNAFRRTHK